MSEDAAALEHLREDGYAILRGVLSPAEVDAYRDALAPVLEAHPKGRNDFEGRSTDRVYALLGKCPAIAPLVEHPRVLALGEAFLDPAFLVSSVQAIRIHAGESAQPLHADDDPVVFERPRPPHGISTMWALDRFTKTNGSTRLVPGSHRSASSAPHDDADAVMVEMDPGDVLVYLGGVMHGGGAHTAGPARLGISIIYCEPWLRQFENLMMATPLHVVRGLSPRLQAMLGYATFRAFGSIDGRNPRHVLELGDER